MSGAIEIKCAYTRLVPIDVLQKCIAPNNPNKHPEEQIVRLMGLIKYYGVRHPIILDAEKGTIEAGHGRLEAATRLGMTEYPVDEQRFGSDEERYGFMVADNAIQQQWAELDLSAINLEVGALGPDFDLDMLGLKAFTIDVAEQGFPELPAGDKAPFQQMTFTLHDEQVEQVKRAMEVARGMGSYDGPNENHHGNALARVCETFLTTHG